jgi:prepilin-type N-terminal cleavage/methylation domain-containing protein
MTKQQLLNNQSHQRGFTMIETIITIAVFAIIIITLTTSVIYFYRANSYSLEQSFAIESGQDGVGRITQDLREMTYSDVGSYPIVSIKPNEITFYANIDTDPGIEKVHYYLLNEILYRDTSNATSSPLKYPDTPDVTATVARYVRNVERGESIFTYFATDGSEVTDLDRIADVHFVRLNLIVNVSPERLPNEFGIRSSAALRNI